MKFSVHQLSRSGDRASNEDRIGYCYTKECALFILSDGMGGHPRGEVAAELTLRSIAQYFHREAQPNVADPKEFLVSALMLAHRSITSYTMQEKLFDSPRATLVLLLLQHKCAWWLHCGDSRLYWILENSCKSRTQDHTNDTKRTLFTGLGSENKRLFMICMGRNF